MINAKWRAVTAVGLGFLLAGCGEEDLTSIRVSINADGSGTIMASAVSVPDQRSGIEAGTVGATWSDRVTITAVSGSFAVLSQLVVGGISFDQNVSGSGMVSLDVVVPLGPEARWTKMISPMTPDQRVQSARAFDRDGRLKSLGSTFKMVIELPSDVVSTGVAPRLSGVFPSSRDNTVELLIPVDTALAETGSLRWSVTWLK